MSATLVSWSESDEIALAGVQGKMQSLVSGRTLTRPEVLRVLVRAAAAGVNWMTLVSASVADTIPPEGG